MPKMSAIDSLTDDTLLALPDLIEAMIAHLFYLSWDQYSVIRYIQPIVIKIDYTT